METKESDYIILAVLHEYTLDQNINVDATLVQKYKQNWELVFSSLR